MARINLYAQNRHLLVIDGIPCSGFKEGDHMNVELDGNEATRQHGGDGPVMSISTSQGGKLTFGFNPTSPVLGILYKHRDQQQSNPRLFSVQLITGVEEIISAEDCAYGKLPAFSTGGPNMQGRDLVIESLNIKLDTSVLESLL